MSWSTKLKGEEFGSKLLKNEKSKKKVQKMGNNF